MWRGGSRYLGRVNLCLKNLRLRTHDNFMSFPTPDAVYDKEIGELPCHQGAKKKKNVSIELLGFTVSESLTRPR